MELDVAARALIKLVVLPPGCIVLVLGLGFLLHRRRIGRILVFIGIAGLYLLSTPAIVMRMAALVETVPAPGMAEIRDSGAQAILVFMAGLRQGNPELAGADALSALSLQRLDHAASLHRQTGLPVIVSGGSVDGRSTALAQLGGGWLQGQAGVRPLLLESASRDTWENARYSKQLLDRRGIRRVLLVTHAFHMPRALWSARTTGIDALPAPFGFVHIPEPYRADLRPGDWLPRASTLEDSYLLLHEALGLAWYRLSRQ
ncbi:MAG: YdcF family protein [Gammaproteobacteria bacterium]|nr:YdcF family protein [Gammaproteobacteria bacterium]